MVRIVLVLREIKTIVLNCKVFDTVAELQLLRDY